MPQTRIRSGELRSFATTTTEHVGASGPEWADCGPIVQLRLETSAGDIATIVLWEPDVEQFSPSRAFVSTCCRNWRTGFPRRGCAGARRCILCRTPTARSRKDSARGSPPHGDIGDVTDIATVSCLTWRIPAGSVVLHRTPQQFHNWSSGPAACSVN